MAARPLPSWRFVSFNEAEVEKLPGKTHYWYNKPGLVQDTNLMFVRAHLLPGEAHLVSITIRKWKKSFMSYPAPLSSGWNGISAF